MTELLVSVRNGQEARAALRGGAGVIDIKDPARGSLGAATAADAAEVVRDVGHRAVLSLSLGELNELTASAPWPEAVQACRYVKLGLAGVERWKDWRERWKRVVAALPIDVIPVAVVYADWRAAGAPPPHDVVATGAALGCGATLLDTYDKRSGALFTHLRPTCLARLLTRIRRARMQCVMAGSLTAKLIPQALWWRPDLIAVRGAACRGGRGGAVDATLVRRLAACLQASGNVS